MLMDGFIIAVSYNCPHPRMLPFFYVPKNTPGVIFTLIEVFPMKLPTFISCNFLKYDFPQYYSKKISPDIEIFNNSFYYILGT